MLSIQNISFSYKDKPTLTSISIALKKGKTLSIIGESGCGKSTLLKLIYGLYDLNDGQIFWKENKVLGPKYNLIPGMDYMKYLAQDFDLMPFITVAENVGKYLSNIYKEKKNERISELLEIVEMTEFANTKAQFLSGGQMQRVAIARVLALEPEILLLDEPFSHIDNFRKNSLRRKLFSYLKEKQITTIIATHDATDVLSYADEVIVMKDGEIIEKGNPKLIYNFPKNSYVASLFDDVNEITINGKKELFFPHQLQIVEKSNLKITVLNCYFRGSHYLVEAKFENQILFFINENDLQINSEIFLKRKEL
ncbi:ABC transporter ATP-binding protein [Flavobacterium dankookense]|uniref:ABC-type Fe3+/spermidine/putrescine transport system ATPase subunit n=1 Tax=Flavobacterium dankookense TaxID=706186 RepID=A0A4R6Q6V2_9FLAO|nr:ABC transporter ATP-binding protein [Flavobacterium dankookense]TDP57333.1 ABC-type Fe3+/spermidine/putrescine transport system ATPase subunit [Flavobacterium dankookense]